MKLNLLFASIAAIAAGSVVLPANAVYNLYKRDGLTLDFAGQVAAEGKHNQDRIKYIGSRANTDPWVSYYDKAQKKTVQKIVDEYDDYQNDRRTRLGLNDSSSWLLIRGTQRISGNLRATGTIQMGYYGGYVNLSSANVALDYKNLGTLTIGKQYLLSPTHSSTYYPTEFFGASSVRVDYTAIPNLHVSAYHLFPAKDDVRTEATANYSNEVRGDGVAGTYTYKIAPDHSIAFGAAYSKSKFNPTAGSNTVYRSKKAGLVSAEYRFKDLRIGADYGRENLDYDRTARRHSLDEAKNNIWGAKVTYDITPRFTVSASYGEKDSKSTGTSPAATGQFVTSSTFAKSKQKIVRLQTDYDLYENVNIFAKANLTKTKNYVGENGKFPFTERENRSVSAGISVTF